MGLDMYLKKRTYVGAKFSEKLYNKPANITVEACGRSNYGIQPKRVVDITEEVGYWRKANQIHNWFVKNVQDGNDECQESYVDIDQLRELLDICKAVKENPEKAETLLPVCSGFFFGSTAYDVWYFNEIDDTIEILEKVIKEFEEDKENEVSFYYQASW